MGKCQICKKEKVVSLKKKKKSKNVLTHHIFSPLRVISNLGFYLLILAAYDKSNKIS